MDVSKNDIYLVCTLDSKIKKLYSKGVLIQYFYYLRLFSHATRRIFEVSGGILLKFVTVEGPSSEYSKFQVFLSHSMTKRPKRSNSFLVGSAF